MMSPLGSRIHTPVQRVCSQRNKCLNSSLHLLTPGPLPLLLALFPASAWQRFSPGLPKLTSEVSSKTLSGQELHKCLCLPVTSKEQTHSSSPGWEEKSPSPLSYMCALSEDSDRAVDSAFLPAQVHLRSVDSYC